MNLIAYIDESGTHGSESPHTILAGYIASSMQWRDFEVRWGRIRKKYNFSTFHAKELRARRGEFLGWSESRQEEFIKDADALIKRRTKFGFVLKLNHEDYILHYISNGRPKKIPMDSIYGICFRVFLGWISSKSKEFLQFNDPSIVIILEAGHKNAGDALRIYEQFRRVADPAWNRVIRDVKFVKKGRAAGLEVADLLAYVMFREEKNNCGNSVRVLNENNLADTQRNEGRNGLVFRFPIEADTLRQMRNNILAQQDERLAYGRNKRQKSTLDLDQKASF